MPSLRGKNQINAGNFTIQKVKKSWQKPGCKYAYTDIMTIER